MLGLWKKGSLLRVSWGSHYDKKVKGEKNKVLLMDSRGFRVS